MLAGLDLSIEAGERVLVAGPSGAGKSTLLRSIAGLLHAAGDGDLSGSVTVDGDPPGNAPGQVAMLLQDPTAAVVAATVGRDVAFGLENVRAPRAEIWRIVEQMLRETAFPYDASRLTHALSGGEVQRLALAGGLALGARVLLLDEPTSMLDEPTAALVREALLSEVERRRCTLVVVEHRIEPWLDEVDRLVVLAASGEVLADGLPRTVLAEQGAALARAGVWVPGVESPEAPAIDPALVEPLRPSSGPALAAHDVEVRLTHRGSGRRRTSVTALARVDATLSGGSALTVTGPSGAGKSTLLTVLAGLLRPTRGRVVAASALVARGRTEPWQWSSRELASRVSWAPQVPEAGMVTSRVRDEIAATGQAIGRDQAWLQRRCDGLLAVFGLDTLADANPHHLSGGEQRRLMVAAALAHGPAVATFDEPTVGQDRLTWTTVLTTLAAARDAGSAIGVATHDRGVVARLGDRSQVLSTAVRELS